MAKGRRLTSTALSTQSDRLLGLGNYNYSHNHHHSEFREDEVWSMVEDTPDHHHQYGGSSGVWAPRATTENAGRSSRRNQQLHVGGLSLAFEEIQTTTTSTSTRIMHQFTGNGGGGGPRGGRHVATSAPMNVPDWSKILRVDYSVESMYDSDDHDERAGDSGIEPPHEYLARSRRRNNTMSVYEGVGRTLKGRDLSRVRDAVWSQTGFEG